MNYYSFGNPRGTSNSEYGKFSYCNSLQGPNITQSSCNLTGDQNASWNTQQGYHHANCRNHLQQGYGNGYGGPGGEDGSNFSVNVNTDQDHATASFLEANGMGNWNSEPVNSNQYQSGFDFNPQQSQSNEGHHESPDYSDAGEHGMTEAMIQPEHNSGDQTGLGQAGAEPSVENTQEDTAAVQTVPTKPKAAVKWRGLPKKGDGPVKFGRHVLPSHQRPNQNQMQMPYTMPQQMQNPQRFGQGIVEKSPNGNNMVNSMSRMSVNGKQRTPSTMNLSCNKRNQNAQASAQLCGKCTKCKNLIPPDLGPSTMTFPSRSGLRNTTRSLQTLGQDAKNFRAIRYTTRVDK